MKKILIILCSIFLLSLCSCSTKNTELSSGTWKESFNGNNLTYNAAYIVDGIDATLTGGEYETLEGDNVVFLVINGGHLNIKDATIKKSGEPQLTGTSTYKDREDQLNMNMPGMPEPPKDEDGNPLPPPDGDMPTDENGNPMPPPDFESDQYNFFGMNSAILCKGKDSSITIENCTIETDAKSSNAIFAIDNGKINIKNSKLITHKDFSRGLFASYQGIVEAENVEITTEGEHCPGIATDIGGGEITTNKCTINTTGHLSPITYSTGNITINDSEGKAEDAEVAVIEGNNTVNLKNCNFTSNYVDSAFLCYQSTPGKNNDYVSKLNLENTNIKYTNSGTVIWVTNTTSEITSKNSVLNNTSNMLIRASRGKWGNQGKNFGTLTFNSYNNTYKGSVVTDEESKIIINANNSDLDFEKSGNITIN